MRTLIAGGGGFIGCHLVDKLLGVGDEVTVVDNFITGRRSNLTPVVDHPRFRLVEGDVGTLPLLEIGDAPFDRIYHLASPASPVGYAMYPIETMMVNAVGTKALLERAKRDGARFLITSTSEVYGEPLVHPQPEDYRGNVSTVGPRSCYDEGKRFAESLSMNYYWEYGVDVRISRLFNTYGPRVAPNDGRIVSNFCIQALTGQPLTVNGDGSQTRSLCFVSDTVRGLISLMESNSASGEVVNIGNPEEYSVLELAKIIIELTASESSVAYLPLPKDDPTRRRPDITKAQRMLSWAPEVGLREGLTQVVEHYAFDYLTPEASRFLDAASGSTPGQGSSFPQKPSQAD